MILNYLALVTIGFQVTRRQKIRERIKGTRRGVYLPNLLFNQVGE